MFNGATPGHVRDRRGGPEAHAGAWRPTRVRQRVPEPGSRAERELQRQAALVRKRDATEAVRNPSVTTNPLIQEIRAVYEKGGLSAIQAFATKRGLPLTAVLAALGLGARSQASDGGSRRRS